jgi:hypothetical protein
MTGSKTRDRNGVRVYPPPPEDFDPFAATRTDFVRHGLPLRPDPQTEPGMAALWERQAARYRGFERAAARQLDGGQEGRARAGAGAGPHRVVRLPALQLLRAVHRAVRHLDGARPAVPARPG